VFNRKTPLSADPNYELNSKNEIIEDEK